MEVTCVVAGCCPAGLFGVDADDSLEKWNFVEFVVGEVMSSMQVAK